MLGAMRCDLAQVLALVLALKPSPRFTATLVQATLGLPCSRESTVCALQVAEAICALQLCCHRSATHVLATQKSLFTGKALKTWHQLKAIGYEHLSL
jgi:acid phosphatase family membrane protein YuiD